jgi:hypothetical protein
VYITGLSYDTWSGPSGQAPLHAHSGYCDIVVFKLDAAGSYQWHTFYGLEADGYMTQGSDSGNGIAVDSSGNIYIAGGSNGSWNGPGGEPPLHEFMIDLFITYYEGYHDITVLKLKTGIHADDYMNLPLVFNSSE